LGRGFLVAGLLVVRSITPEEGTIKVAAEGLLQDQVLALSKGKSSYETLYL